MAAPATVSLALCGFLVAVLTAATAGAAEADGPFGVTMGSAPDAYGCEASDTPGLYICASLPRMHPDLHTYTLVAWPDVGICKVSAFTDTIETNQFGDALRAATDRLAEQLELRYGDSRLIDELKAGSLREGPEYWMSAVRYGDRTYAYIWAQGYTPDLPADIEEIDLIAQAANSRTGRVSVQFFFANADLCREAEKKAKAGAF